MLLTPKQLEYARNANRRWNFKGGATRSGKTYLDYRWMIPMRIRERIGKEGLTVILGVTKSTIERNVLEPMRNLYGDLVGEIGSDNTARIFGEKCYCLGAEKLSQVSKLRGASFKYVYGDEVADWSPDVFDMLGSRMDKPYSLFDGTYNPQGPTHWLHTFLQRDDVDLFAQTYTIDDNPFLPTEFVQNLKAEYAGTVLYDRYILGLWAAAEGALFTTYPQYNDSKMVFRDGICHIDAAYGGTDYTAFTCGQRHGDKIYLYGKIWRKHVDTVLNICIDEAKRMMCAPINCETNGDKGYLAKEIIERGYAAKTYTEFENKHIKISTFLKKWWPNIVFYSGTDKAYIAQIMSYTESSEHDDAPDSAACVCRYFDRRNNE